MKTAFLRLALLLPLLVSCAPVRDRRTLNEMETLMPERPDSALAVLRGLQPRDLPGLHVRPLHALLLSEALDKNYIDLTDDSLALAANRFYGSHGSRLHRLKSWYYLGRIRFNSSNYAEAVICYNKALEYAESLENYHYIGLINREIANAYDMVWDTFHAVECLEKSVNAFNDAGEDKYKAYSMLALAKGYMQLMEFEKSRLVVSEINRSLDDRYLASRISELTAELALSEGHPDKESVLSNLNDAGIGIVLTPTSPRYSMLALAHQMVGNADSADFYVQKAKDISVSLMDSIAIARAGVQIEEARGNHAEAFKLLSRSVHSQDSLVYDALRQSVAVYQGEYYKKESALNNEIAKVRLLICSIVILLLFILAIYLVALNKKQRARIVEDILQIKEIYHELEEMQQKKEGADHVIATLFENRMKILQTLSDQYEIVEESQNERIKEKRWGMSKDEIIASFRQKMRDLRKDKDIALSMEEILDTWKDGIMDKLYRIFGADNASGVEISQEELDLAPYFFSGMNYKTISYLTGFSEPSLRVRKTRIRHKIQTLDDSFSVEKRLFLENL